MRFRRFDLIAFGKFTSVSLEFPAGPLDLHVIYGPNEAGKSTLREATVDFLYGIPGQTRYNFQHDYGRMRLGAAVEGRGAVLDLQRRKGRRSTLLDAAGDTVADATLERLLGGSDRAFFKRMFALSHEQLRTGGEAILEGRDDAGAALFAAAAGVQGLPALRAELEQAAKTMWTPRKSKNVAYHQLKEALDAAAEEKKAAVARVNDYQTAEEKRREADAAYRAAQQRQNKLNARRSQLERIRRTAPYLRARREAQQERAALGDLLLLPEDAAETLNGIETRIGLARDRIERGKPEIARLEETLEQLQPDSAVLAQADEIEALIEDQLSLRRHPADIIKRQTEVRAAEARIVKAARDLGWSEASAKALESRAPLATARRELSEALQQRGALDGKRQSAREALEESESRLRDSEAKAAALEARPVSAEWKAALGAARTLGDAAARTAELEQAVEMARREWSQALAGLSPWSGSAEQLRERPAVSAEQARSWLEERRQAVDAVKKVEDKISEVTTALADKRVELDQLVRDRAPVTGRQVKQAREGRDRIWGEIVAGARPLGEARTSYEEALAEADSVADRRFERAEEASAWTALTNEIERLEERQKSLQTKYTDAQKRLEEPSQSWRSTAGGLGDAGFPLEDYPGWLADRGRALEKAEALERAEAELAEYAQRGEQLTAALRARWEGESGLPIPPDEDRLGAWVERTGSRHQELLAVAGKKAERAEQVEKDSADWGRARQAAERAEEAWTEWERNWNARLAAVDLPSSTSPVAADEALRIFNDLDDAIKESRDKQGRIGAMQADQQHFVDAARRLALELAPDLAERSAAETAEALHARLQVARDDRKERGRLVDALTAEQKKQADAEDDLAAAEAELRPLLSAAEADDITALRDAVGRSDKARDLDKKISEAAEAAFKAGSPLALGDLQAEMDAEDSSDPAPELAQIETDLAVTQERIESAIDARNNAEHELERFGAGDAAAQAEARRQEALSEMIAVSERWVRATVETRLLSWAIQRYRESHQGPLLQRAGELFGALTLGSFERLTVEDEGDGAMIMARRGGDELGVDAMSEGTRDQLYLALRVAALELHLDKGEPLPFLADDLFVNWDNDRAKAGLRVLAELAQRTQVLFLTHHKHLIELACDTLRADCSTVTLEGD